MNIETQDLTPYFKKPDILAETANQIIKDFDIASIEISFSGNTDNSYNELFDQILPHIAELLNNNSGKLYSLLYRIDLNENQITKAIQSNRDKNISEIITDLIIKRELQKVVIRNYYKQQ